MLHAERLQAADAAVGAREILLRKAVGIDKLNRAVGHLQRVALVSEGVELRAHLAQIPREVVLVRDPIGVLPRPRRGGDVQVVRAILDPTMCFSKRQIIGA